MASVGVAMEAAEQAERNAMQVSLFDVFDDGATNTGRSTSRCRAGKSGAARRGDRRSVSSSLVTVQRGQGRGLALRAPRSPDICNRARKPQFMAGLVLGIAFKITGAARWPSSRSTTARRSRRSPQRSARRRARPARGRGADRRRQNKGRLCGQGAQVSVERLVDHSRGARLFRPPPASDAERRPSRQARRQTGRGAAFARDLAPFSPGNCPVRIVSNGVARCELQLGDATGCASKTTCSACARRLAGRRTRMRIRYSLSQGRCDGAPGQPGAPPKGLAQGGENGAVDRAERQRGNHQDGGCGAEQRAFGIR